MTNDSKFKSLSIVAGVISLYFGFCVVFGLAVVAYSRWSFLKTIHDLGLVARPDAVPHITAGIAVRLAVSSIVAVAAFWCRSYLRRRMMLAQGSA